MNGMESMRIEDLRFLLLILLLISNSAKNKNISNNKKYIAISFYIVLYLSISFIKSSDIPVSDFLKNG